MKRLFAVAELTLTSILRSRLTWFALVAGLALGVLTRLLAGVSLGQDARLTADLVQAGVVLLGIILTIVTTATTVMVEQEAGAILIIRSKPLTTGEFIGGKYLGFLTGMTFEYILVAAGALAVVGWHAALPWANLLITLAVGWGELAIVAAIGTFFASLSAPLLATLLTAGGWFVGRSFGLILSAASRSGGTIEKFVHFIGWFVPNLSRFNLADTYLTATQLSGGFYWSLALYGIVWIGILLMLATAVFEQREW